MQLIAAEMNQLDVVMDVYHQVVKVMNELGNFQWGNGYPSRKLIQEDIENGELYLLTDGEEITAAVVLNRKWAPEYEHIEWQERDDSFVVIHRLCVNPLYQGKGIAKSLMDAIEQWVMDQGYMSIRLDTFSENHKAQNLFTLQGYKPRGTFYFSGYDLPFIAFEKRLG
ncbi:GNAT family N-acetyltransferase [Hazenella coriacea]|uniref:Ribosomal protein S18 acetylase RimI-like enzyme n=1 Tax=Hazenella coriacea TaxID=1179467 RepID=A0A4R3L8Z6_9BACL|nr:GNAT family N-acetyltransferase [Hazenella coriacea]TCS95560.1 ribosomal protein S18 acetylase RimI-like enzyme [Hazenella coriacea]